MTNTNQAPVFSTDITDQTDAEGDVVSLDADATDADLDTLTYSATGLPGGVTINAEHGRHQWHAELDQLGHLQRRPHRSATARSPTPTPSPGRSPTPTRPRSSAPSSPTGPTPRATSSASTPTRPMPTRDTLTYSATDLPAGITHQRRAPASSAAPSARPARARYNVVVTVATAPLTDTDAFTWTVTEPVTGSALDFDGVNDHVTLRRGADLNSNTFTIETWFRRDGTGTPATTSGTRWRDRHPARHQGPLRSRASSLNWFLGIDSADQPPRGRLRERRRRRQPPAHRHDHARQRHLVPRRRHLRRHDLPALPQRRPGGLGRRSPTAPARPAPTTPRWPPR